MLTSLITKSIKENDITWIEKLPRQFLTESENRFVDWLMNYQHEYKTLPTIDRVDETEYSIYLDNHMTTSPLGDLYKMTVEMKRENYALKNFHEIQLEIDKGSIPTQRIIDLGFQLSQASDNAIFLSDFNRDDLYSEESPKGVKFGFPLIDEHTGGLLAGEFGVIAARPETGKTWLTNFITWNVVTDYGHYENCKTVLYLSAEMTPDKIATRMDAIAGGFNTKILRNKLNKQALKEAKQSATKAWQKVKQSGGNVIIPKIGLIYPQTVLDMINTYKPDFVIVDAMYRMVTTGSNKDWRSDAEIVRQVANISRITNTPILGTTQLIRNSNPGTYRLDDLSFTDSYSQEASLVLGAYNMPSMRNSIIIDTLKARDGTKLGSIEIKIDFDKASYTEHLAVNQEDD